eukprot:Skav232497  [mRNA]  locus=scaffold1096:9732:27390:+ [translate_table: standard]
MLRTHQAQQLLRFTPVESGLGGLMIGASAAMAYLIDGKITGISGIMGPFFRGLAKCEPMKDRADGQLWKLLFLTGLVLGGLIDLAFNRDFSFPPAPPMHVMRYLLAGCVAVGIGTRVGKGCTSGHGICGLPRFSLRSWTGGDPKISVPTFMGVAAGTIAITRHALKMDGTGYSPQVAPLQWPPQWEFPVGALGASLCLIALSVVLPDRFKMFVSPLSSGLIFAFGLGTSGMTNPMKVGSDSISAGYWDPSLAFVMGCGICAAWTGTMAAMGRSVLNPVQWQVTKPLTEGCKFENPPKRGNYAPLVLGTLPCGCFGLGWGLIGLCPGPALVAIIPRLAEKREEKIVTGILQPWHSDFALSGAAVMICVTWLVTDRVILRLGRGTAVEGCDSWRTS